MKISGNIITLNEEANITDCINSLKKVCNEIIVVDSGSKDKTIEIAQSLGAKVIHQVYLGDGFQKNVALKEVQYNWVLSLDADERLTEEMIKDIRSIDLESTQFDAFSFRRKNMIGSRWIKHCGWYPDNCTRLYNHTKTKFKEVKQHSSVPANSLKTFNSDIIHFSFKNIGELFAKPGRNFSGRPQKSCLLKAKNPMLSLPSCMD